MTSEFTIQDNKDLQALNTLAVPSTARWFVSVQSESDLQQAFHFQRRQACPLLVIGGGSNVVLPEYFPGLVVQINLKGRSIESENDTEVHIALGAGENWHDMVMWTVANGWYGIENLALIPGSVGAAPIQNIGAYGVELADCFLYLDAFSIKTGQKIRLEKDTCQFGYRDSLFKHKNQDPLVITRVVLSLSKQGIFHTNYPALQQELAGVGELNLEKVADAVIDIRQRKLPNPKVTPNAGSFFKNPIVDEQQYAALKEKYPSIVAHGVGDRQHKLAAGWLLEQAGWRGKPINGVSMYTKQALVLTNPHHKTGEQLLDFSHQVQQSIQQLFGIELEIEPRVVTV